MHLQTVTVITSDGWMNEMIGRSFIIKPCSNYTNTCNSLCALSESWELISDAM